MSVTLHHGDCREVLAGMEPESVDAIVCDPPYELAFMNKGWDNAGVSFDAETWRACLRVLKPGGHLLAFGGTRTVHRIAVAIEDAGFEIRDQIVWMYGSGFPKSLDVSKAMDKAAGAEREVVGRRPVSYPDSDCWSVPCQNIYADGGYSGGWKPNAEGGTRPVTAPATDLARQYAGFGTALKPAHEPVVVARKPLIGTVAANVTEYGTGALNIDGCRIGRRLQNESGWSQTGSKASNNRAMSGPNYDRMPKDEIGLGRWPANVCLDEDAAALLDAQSGKRGGGYGIRGVGRSVLGSNGSLDRITGQTVGYGDTGGASRFYYVAKASRSERNAGLDGMPEHVSGMSNAAQLHGAEYDKAQSIGLNRAIARQNHHPTVKPISLMRWLVRLVTPPDGIVCDPFLGSGTTGCAAALEGFAFVGIEQDAEYLEIARRRIAHVQGPLFAGEGAA